MISPPSAADRKWETPGKPSNPTSDTSDQIKSHEMKFALISSDEAEEVGALLGKSLEFFKQLSDGPVTVTLNVSYHLRPLREMFSSPSETSKGS